MKMILVGALAFLIFAIVLLFVYVYFLSVTTFYQAPIPERFKAVFLILAAWILWRGRI